MKEDRSCLKKGTDSDTSKETKRTKSSKRRKASEPDRLTHEEAVAMAEEAREILRKLEPKMNAHAEKMRAQMAELEKEEREKTGK